MKTEDKMSMPLPTATDSTEGAGRTESPPAHDGIRVVSFDVFETVLVRPAGDPAAVFYEAARRCAEALPVGFTPKIWCALRVRAQWNARNLKGGDATMAEIYQQLRLLTGLDDAVVERLRAVELRLEREWLCAMPGAAARVAAFRRAGRRIVFTSDMYLPAETIRGALQDNGLWEAGDRLFVSCECGMSKRSGELFRHVCEECGVEPGEILHVGNARIADYEKPVSLGLRAQYLGEGNLNRFEARL